MFISYVSPGYTTSPQDDPVAAFNSVFGGVGTASGSGGGGGSTSGNAAQQLSVLDNAAEEISALESQLGSAEKSKLDLHLQAVREVETRIQALGGSGGGTTSGGSPGVELRDASRSMRPASTRRRSTTPRTSRRCCRRRWT